MFGENVGFVNVKTFDAYNPKKFLFPWGKTYEVSR